LLYRWTPLCKFSRKFSLLRGCEAGSVSLIDSAQNSNGFRLDGKTAIVTGGASGIGRAITVLFASSGACVRVLDIDAKGAEDTAQEIRDAGGDASAHECDVTDHKDVRAVFQALAKRGPIHTLVNNAGISHIGKLEATTERDFDRVYQVNVKGIYNCMIAAVEHMKENGGGVILNMASIAGSSGLADRFAYSASKGAVIAMTYSVAKDYLACNIRCNCISPARVHTPFVDGYLRQHYPGREEEMFTKLSHSQPIGRMAEPHEVASLALFLCSDAASFLTGVDYPLDGGFFNLRG
jgi:NAD(P)-dependent dehydrogenase (short-subunit alcohol dehydrogenase family)